LRQIFWKYFLCHATTQPSATILTEKAMAEGSGTAREISLGDNFGDVAVKANGARVEIHTDGSAVVYTNGDVKVHPAPANDSLLVPPIASSDVSSLLPAKAAHEIGAIEKTGEHKGEIYGGIFPDGKPGWILEEPKPLTHYEASELKGRALPTSKEGKYIDTIKDKGALRDIFARHSDSSSSAVFFWLAEHYYYYGARYQQFSDGRQSNYDGDRNIPLPVLSVRR
jgi:hypothetical protein